MAGGIQSPCTDLEAELGRNVDFDNNRWFWFPVKVYDCIRCLVSHQWNCRPS